MRSSITSFAPVAGLLALVAAACDSAPPAKTEPSARPVETTKASAAPVAPSASAPAPSASAVPSAPAPSASAAAPAAPNFPSEKPAPVAPGEGEFAAAKEIAVKASSEQKCTTKVLQGWFEMVCGEAEGLVRARKVDVEAGFDGDRSILEADEAGKWMRWVVPLPEDGSLCRARFYGKGLHEIFLTLENGDNGWKGALSGKRPEPAAAH